MMKNYKLKQKKGRGFTLVELIVTLIVLSVMAFSVMYILTEGFRVWWVNKDLINIRSDSRSAINRIVMEFREAYSGTLTSGTDFSFTADVSDTGSLQTVRYYLDTGNLRRQVAGSPSSGNIICGNISSLIFSWSSPILTIDMTLSEQGNTIRARTRAEGRCI